MLYKGNTIEDIDSAYIKSLSKVNLFHEEILADCRRVQRVFSEKNIKLTLRECQEVNCSYLEETPITSIALELDELSDYQLYKELSFQLRAILKDRIKRLAVITTEIECFERADKVNGTQLY